MGVKKTLLMHKPRGCIARHITRDYVFVRGEKGVEIQVLICYLIMAFYLPRSN